MSVDWTLSRECVVGGVEKGRIEGVSSSTESIETHDVSGTGGTVTFTGSAFATEGATVSLTCGDTTVVEKTVAAPAPPITGSLTLGRAAGDALKVDWTLSRECVVGGVEKGRIEGVSSSTESTETHDVSGTGGTVTFTGSAFTTEGATVSLTCDGTTVVEKTIAAPDAPTTGNPAPPITGSLTLGRAAGDALKVDWTLSRECVVDGVEKGRIKGVSSSTESAETHDVSGTGGTVTFSGSAFRTEGATVSLTCDGTTVVEKTIAAPDAPTTGNPAPPTTGNPASPITSLTLTLSRGGDYSVSAVWSFAKACDSNPRIRATASGSAADSVDLTGTSGSQSFSTAQYRNVSATVELRCDGVALATETIAAPVGSLTLTRDSSDNVEAAWTLNPTCAAGKVITSPSGETATHDTAISGTSGTVTTSATAYTTKGADVRLLCNDAEIATKTIEAPPLKGTVTPSRDASNDVVVAWSLSRACPGVASIFCLSTDNHLEGITVSGTSGSVLFTSSSFRSFAVTVDVRCGTTIVATATMAAP